MTNEHTGTCIYEKGRFELRETDNAIIDLKGDFPPIMIASNTVDDGFEPNYADRRGVLHLLNELSDENKQLNKLLDENLDEYEYIVRLEKENQKLKTKLVNVIGCVVKIEEYTEKIKQIAYHKIDLTK